MSGRSRKSVCSVGVLLDLAEQTDGGVLLAARGVEIVEAAVSVHEELVEVPVLRQRVLRADLQHVRRGFVQVLVGHARVEVAQGEHEVLAQHEITERLPLRFQLGAHGGLPPQVAQPVEYAVFELGLGDHHSTSSTCFSASLTRSSPLMSAGRRVSRREARVRDSADKLCIKEICLSLSPLKLISAEQSPVIETGIFSMSEALTLWRPELPTIR